MITLDISESDIGDSLHISQINLPEGVDPTITDRDFTIATIAAPTVMTEEEETGDEQDDDTEATADDASSTDAGSDSDETSNDS